MVHSSLLVFYLRGVRLVWLLVVGEAACYNRIVHLAGQHVHLAVGNTVQVEQHKCIQSVAEVVVYVEAQNVAAELQVLLKQNGNRPLAHLDVAHNLVDKLNRVDVFDKPLVDGEVDTLGTRAGVNVSGQLEVEVLLQQVVHNNRLGTALEFTADSYGAYKVVVVGILEQRIEDASPEHQQ